MERMGMGKIKNKVGLGIERRPKTFFSCEHLWPELVSKRTNYM